MKVCSISIYIWAGEFDGYDGWGSTCLGVFPVGVDGGELVDIPLHGVFHAGALQLVPRQPLLVFGNVKLAGFRLVDVTMLDLVLVGPEKELVVDGHVGIVLSCVEA